MDYPDKQMIASGINKGRRKLTPPTSRLVDIGRVGIGQGDLEATALQMASVAQTIGNGGVRMKPRLVGKVLDPDGRTIDEPLPEEAERVMSADSARKLGDLMRNVVKEGTGTAAALEGVSVGGKTGTAEVDRPCGPNQAWFIAFAPRHDPKVAIATTVECTSGTGGDTAAPIAKQVMQELLR